MARIDCHRRRSLCSFHHLPQTSLSDRLNCHHYWLRRYRTYPICLVTMLGSVNAPPTTLPVTVRNLLTSNHSLTFACTEAVKVGVVVCWVVATVTNPPPGCSRRFARRCYSNIHDEERQHRYYRLTYPPVLIFIVH